MLSVGAIYPQLWQYTLARSVDIIIDSTNSQSYYI